MTWSMWLASVSKECQIDGGGGDMSIEIIVRPPNAQPGWIIPPSADPSIYEGIDVPGWSEMWSTIRALAMAGF